MVSISFIGSEDNRGDGFRSIKTSWSFKRWKGKGYGDDHESGNRGDDEDKEGLYHFCVVNEL